MEMHDEFWDERYAERLHFADRDEAIEHQIESVAILPDVVEVCRYARMDIQDKVDKKYEADRVIEQLIKSLDEDYGDPEGSTYNPPCEKMKKAALEFVEKILKIYVPWHCERKECEEVDAREWCKENRPDLLKNRAKPEER